MDVFSRRTRSFLCCLLQTALFTVLLRAAPALAQGAETAGRGGTFVARADTPLALLYNPAGATQTAGTVLVADLGLVSLAGSASTTYVCRPCFLPLVAVTSDLGRPRRWRLLVGVAAERPFSRDSRTYVVAPPHYPITPRLGVAVRINDRLSLGVTLQNVFDIAQSCEGPACTLFGGSLLNLSAQLGVLVRPHERWRLGMSLRTASNLGLREGASLPWVLLVGGRYAHPAAGGERFDLELDLAYAARGPRLYTHPTTMQPVDLAIAHRISPRLGGGLYQPLGPVRLALRAGLFADLDVQRMIQLQGIPVLLGERVLGVTLGAGLGWSRGMVNLAYALTFTGDVGFGVSPLDHALTLGATVSLPGR